MEAITVFLIGKTGHGKSSTGNSLLGRDAFMVSDSSTSATKLVQIAKATVNNRRLIVVDGPGIGDTRMDSGTDIRRTCEDMKQGISAHYRGIGAFIIVLKYGVRFTAEEKEILDSLKQLLGEHFVRDHGVIVFTHGEYFEMNNRRTGLTFEGWCSRQDGPVRDLIAESNNRCILAYNMEPDKMATSIRKLFNYVDNLVRRNGTYTLQHYDSMDYQREQLIVLLDAPQIQEEVQTKVEVLSSTIVFVKILHDIMDGCYETKLEKLASIKETILNLKRQIIERDKGTGILETQMQACDSLMSDVRSQEGAVREERANEEAEREQEELRARLRRLRVELDRERERSNVGNNNDTGNECTIL